MDSVEEYTIRTLIVTLIFSIGHAFPSGSVDAGAHAWCYGHVNCGPGHWSGVCSRGRSQSPVDLVIANAKRSPDWHISVGGDYCKAHQDFNIRNNGHSVEIHLDDPQIHHSFTGVGFPDTYVLSHVHVHWGPTDSTGSEHSINGQRHTMEMHFVHQKYDHVKKKLADESPTDGLAVIGVMFETDFSPMAVNNPHLDPIIKVLREVNGSSPDKILQVNHTSIYFFSLLPSDKMALRYQGSLTTPPCSEKVIWTVYETPAKVSQAQIRSFRSLLMPNGKPFKDNARPVQPLHKRDVQRSKFGLECS